MKTNNDNPLSRIQEIQGLLLESKSVMTSLTISGTRIEFQVWDQFMRPLFFLCCSMEDKEAANSIIDRKTEELSEILDTLKSQGDLDFKNRDVQWVRD